MGLADRDYMKGRGGVGGPGGGVRVGGFGGFRHPKAWSATAWLIALNVAVFVVGWAFWAGFVQSLGPGGAVTPGAKEDLFTLRTYGAVREGLPADVRPRVADQPVQLVGGRPLLERSPGSAARDLVDPSTGADVGDQFYLVHPDPVLMWGHFSTLTAFTRLELWRFVTFQFLHAGFWHLALNMIALFYFGPAVEQRLGSRRRFLAFYLACGVCGAALYLLLNLLGFLGVPLPGVLDVEITTPLMGASAGVFGVLLASARFVGNGTIYLFFVLPLPMKLGVYLLFGLSLLNLLFGGYNQGGEAAHVGGALAGAFFAKYPGYLDDFFDDFSGLIGGRKKKGKRKGKEKGSRGVEGSRARSAGKPGELEPLSRREEARLDAILAKVKREGMGALSADETAFLERAREKKRR